MSFPSDPKYAHHVGANPFAVAPPVRQAIVNTPQVGPLAVGDAAFKVGGSYEASGTIVAAFKTKAGEQRYVFEFDTPAGMLHIFGPQQVVKTVSPALELPKLPKTFEAPCLERRRHFDDARLDAYRIGFATGQVFDQEAKAHGCFDEGYFTKP